MMMDQLVHVFDQLFRKDSDDLLKFLAFDDIMLFNRKRVGQVGPSWPMKRRDIHEDTDDVDNTRVIRELFKPGKSMEGSNRIDKSRDTGRIQMLEIHTTNGYVRVRA